MRCTRGAKARPGPGTPSRAGARAAAQKSSSKEILWPRVPAPTTG